MTVTKEDLALLASRQGRAVLTAKPSAPVREGWAAGVLTVFVSGTPKNPLNGSHQHWSKRANWAKGWRERAASAIFRFAPAVDVCASIARDDRRPVGSWAWAATTPKRITFTIHGASRFDDDNLRAVCKPVRDALKDMAVIDDDRVSSGHVFDYAQAKPTRSAGAIHGIAIRVELA